MKKKDTDLKEALNKPKESKEILDEQIQTGMEQYHRSNPELFLSGIAAGLEVGFSVFFMGTLYTLFVGVLHPSFLQALIAITYSIGFIFVVIGRSELFTEHTTLAAIPVLNGNASVKQLLILWGLVYSGNLIGGSFFSFILAILPTNMGIISTEALTSLAYKMLDISPQLMLGSGILAGWLMGLLSWLVTSSQETMSRIFIVTLVTSVIGIGTLHHSVVGSIEVLSGVFIDPDISFLDFLWFLLWTTLGNIIGGVVFVALIKYSHINPRRRYFQTMKRKRRKSNQ